MVPELTSELWWLLTFVTSVAIGEIILIAVLIRHERRSVRSARWAVQWGTAPHQRRKPVSDSELELDVRRTRYGASPLHPYSGLLGFLTHDLGATVTDNGDRIEVTVPAPESTDTTAAIRRVERQQERLRARAREVATERLRREVAEAQLKADRARLQLNSMDNRPEEPRPDNTTNSVVVLLTKRFGKRDGYTYACVRPPGMLTWYVTDGKKYTSWDDLVAFAYHLEIVPPAMWLAPESGDVNAGWTQLAPKLTDLVD